jgi:PII-like signaling protein
MNIEGKASIMKIYVGESDKVNGRPLYEEIVFAARNAGLAGISVFKGILSFGASHSMHNVKTFALSDDLPVLLEIVDTGKNLENFCPVLYKMMDNSKKGGLVTIHKLKVLRYKKDEKFNPFTAF